jgi:hypothetical protein
MAKKKRRTKKRGKARKRATKKDNRAMEKWIFTGIVVIVFFALLFSIPSGNNGLENEIEEIVPTWQEITQETTTVETVVEYPCKSSSGCFLVNCKNNPDVVDCVNVVGMETYHKNCPGSSIKVTIDNSICDCIDGVCK